jgi:hypothetical protein
MAIMSKDKWKSDTSSWNHSRSPELKAVDNALGDYHTNGQRKADLETLDTAFRAWKTSKGNSGLNSVRNQKNVVQHLSDQIDAELLKFAPSIAFQPLRVQAVNKDAVLSSGRNFKSATTTTQTMTDDALVTNFTNKIKTLWTAPVWNSKTKKQRGEAVIAAVSEVHTACNIPNVTADVRALPPGYHGFFDMSNWAIQLSEDLFNFTFSPGNKQKLIDVAETVYHEARHCEQWFHMARYFALGKSAADVARGIGIPQSAADAAWNRRMTSDDKMHTLTESWYESVYGTLNREITLKALSLKRQNNTVDLGDFHTRTYQAYSGDLPEEVDAWAIQLLVRAKL